MNVLWLGLISCCVCADWSLPGPRGIVFWASVTALDGCLAVKRVVNERLFGGRERLLSLFGWLYICSLLYAEAML